MMNIRVLCLFLLICYCLYIYTDDTEHFIPVDSLTSYSEIQDLYQMLLEIDTIFNQLNIEYWITSNTLVGAVRDKVISPWDKTVNICIMNTPYIEFNFNTIINKLDKMKMTVKWDNMLDINKMTWANKKHNIIIYRNDKKDNKIIINLMERNNDMIQSIVDSTIEYYQYGDVYPLQQTYQLNNMLFYGPNNSTNYINTFNTPLPKKIKIDYDLTKKPYLWQYWENKNNKQTPAYIQLCLDSVVANCSKSFNIVVLNETNITKYLPELLQMNHSKQCVDSDTICKTIYDNLMNLPIAQKVDFYRILLLYKYGGIYIDADIVVLRDPIEIIDRLYKFDPLPNNLYVSNNKYELIGFGCTGNKCKDGYGKPSNWIIASKPTSYIISRVLKNLLEKLSNPNMDSISSDNGYHDLGKLVIWDELNKLKKDNYTYYHYPNSIDGSRDANGEWVDSNRAFSDIPIKYDDEKNMLFFVTYNSDISDDVKQMTRDELLSKDYNFTKFIKKALKL